MTWQHQAACRGIDDPDLFFPVARPGSKPHRRQLAAAVAVCQHCPVRPECRTAAYELGEEFGIWDGEPEEQRERVLRAHGTGERVIRRSRQASKPAELSREIVATILARLDAEEGITSVAADYGIGQQVARRIWRAHRSSPNPPRQRVSMSHAAIAKRAGRSRYGRATGGNRPVVPGVSA